MKKTKSKKKTSDGMTLLYNRFLKDNPERIMGVNREILNIHISQAIYALRTSAGLTQKELADHIGTKDTVISRMENNDYNGHSLPILRKIVGVFGGKISLHIVPAKSDQKYLRAPSGEKINFKELVVQG